MQKDILFTVAILSGGQRRDFMTGNAIKSINTQKYKNIQKIFINNGRSDKTLRQIQNIFGAQSSLKNWTIIKVQPKYSEVDGLYNLWGRPGNSLLSIIKGEYIFAQNDDDFVSSDFFFLMNQALKKDKNISTAIGLQYKYDWQHQKIISPNNGDWQKRKKIENGEKVSTILLNNLFSNYLPNNGIPYICRTELVKLSGNNYFEGCYPDLPATVQIMPLGKNLFLKNAKMYLGVHPNQQRKNWDRIHISNGHYYKNFKYFMYANLEGCRRLGNLTTYRSILIRNVFRIMLKKQAKRSFKSSLTLIFQDNKIFEMRKYFICLYHLNKYLWYTSSSVRIESLYFQFFRFKFKQEYKKDL